MTLKFADDYAGDKFRVEEFAQFWTRQMGYPVVEGGTFILY